MKATYACMSDFYRAKMERKTEAMLDNTNDLLHKMSETLGRVADGYVERAKMLMILPMCGACGAVNGNNCPECSDKPRE